MVNTLCSGISIAIPIKIKWKRRMFSAPFNIILKVRKGIKQGTNSKNGDCGQGKTKNVIDNTNKPTSL